MDANKLAETEAALKATQALIEEEKALRELEKLFTGLLADVERSARGGWTPRLSLVVHNDDDAKTKRFYGREREEFLDALNRGFTEKLAELKVKYAAL